MSEVSGITIKAAMQSAYGDEVCQALVGCDLLLRDGEKAFRIEAVDRDRSEIVVLDADGTKRTISITRGSVEAGEQLLRALSYADQPLTSDADFLASKGVVGIPTRLKASIVASELRSKHVPGRKERKEVLNVLADDEPENQRALLAHWVELTPCDRALEPDIAIAFARCLRRAEEAEAAVELIDRALGWSMEPESEIILHTQRAACLMDRISRREGSLTKHFEKLSQSIERISPYSSSDEKVQSVLERYGRIGTKFAQA